MSIIVKFKDLVIESLKDNLKLIIILYALFIISFIAAWAVSGTAMESTLSNMSNFTGPSADMADLSALDIFIKNSWGGIVTYAASIFFAIMAFVSIAYNGVNLGMVGQMFSQLIPNGGLRYIVYLIPHGIFEITALVLQSAAGVLLFLFVWRFIRAMISGETHGVSDSFEKTKKVLIQSLIIMIFSIILLLIAAPIEAYISVPFSELIVGA